MALLFLPIFVSVNIDLVVPISERSDPAQPDQRSEQSALAASELSNIFYQFLLLTIVFLNDNAGRLQVIDFTDLYPTSACNIYPTGTRGLPGRILALSFRG